MQLKHKIVALGILPLVLAIAVICARVISLNRQLGDQQAQLIEDSILASKRAELKNYVEMAQSLIAPLYDDGHGNAMLQRALLDGRGLQLHAAPGGTVGLGQHQGDGKARGEQAFKGNARELGRAGKNDSHAIQ